MDITVFLMDIGLGITFGDVASGITFYTGTIVSFLLWSWLLGRRNNKF